MQNIIGQDRAIETLTAALGSGRVHHAWIFHGPQGVGKFTTAIEAARVLLCHDAGVDLTGQYAACGGCQSCVMFDSADGPEVHPDLHVIRKELALDSNFRHLREKKLTNIPVDLLREHMVGGNVGSSSSSKYVEPVAARSPVMNHGKAFIIDEAELLDDAGQNVLLKTLEEPPRDTFIFLITSAEDLLLSTIRSRCQRVAFRLLDESGVVDFTKTYAEQEAARVEAEIAELEAGGMNKTEQKQATRLRERLAALAMDEEKAGRIARFARGSFGRAQLAIDYELDAWQRALEPMMKALARGEPVADLGPTIVDLVDAFAEEHVDRHKNGSKNVANALAVRHMLGLLAENCRVALNHYASKADPDRPEAAERAMWPWLEGVRLMQEAEAQLGSNVSPALLLDNLAVQWAASLRTAPAA